MGEKATGQFEPPPPGAPHEVSSTEIVHPTEQMLWERRNEAVTRAEERGLPAPPMESAELPAFAPKKLSRAAMKAILGKDPEDVILASKDAPVPVVAPTPIEKPQPRVQLTDPDPIPEQVEPVAEALPPLPPPLPHQRAASDTDTPSRGIPREITDPGKKITGGWGFVGEAEYFPLTGEELLKLVQDMLGSLSGRIADDLRFSIAAVYPRVRATVTIEVSGYGRDDSFLIVKHLPPHEKTPPHVAKEKADEICFVVIAEHLEMAEDGTSVTPPNAVRQDLGMDVPRKRAVQTPTGRMLVDLDTKLT